MLDVDKLCVAYQQHRALENVSIRVEPGEIVVILGANGAGKSTLLRAIGGICEGRLSGSIKMDGKAILGLTSDVIVEHGIALVPEGRGIFADLSVRENMTLGAYCNRARADEAANLDRVMELFPKIRERRNQIAHTMSGGEQQMVAIGRAMMSNPSILMLDEPSLGLSPLLCKELFKNLTQVSKSGIGILLVEQNAKQSLAIADRGYLLENARIVHQDSAVNLASDPAVQKAYLGSGGGKTSPPVTPLVSQVSATVVSTQLPQLSEFVAKPLPRKSADDLIGSSINDMVAKAADSTRQTFSSATSHTSLSSEISHEERLRATISQIENAAADARHNRNAQRGGNCHETADFTAAPGPKKDPKSSKPPVAIEVYKSPKIEVWRREIGSGKFEKIEKLENKDAG
jgi:branched-chain amino acid transport system ATP-binding protein